MLKERFALTDQGAKDLKKGIVSSVFAVLSLMFPIGILVMFLMGQISALLGAGEGSLNLGQYSLICVALLLFIFITHYIQYRCTYIAAYEESAKRRIGLAEKIRILPLSFFGQRDLSDLTTTMMTDCSDLERIFSYTLPQLFGTAIVSAFICIVLFFTEWRMALAVSWVLPVALFVVVASKKLQDHFDRKKIAAKLSSADGVQEYLESIRDLKANNQTEPYLKELDRKLDRVIQASIRYELVSGLLLTCAQMILRLGFATTILTGAVLLGQGEIDLFLYLMFLITASRIYDPLSGVMMQLGEIFNAQLQIERMKDIEREPAQQGLAECNNHGVDLCFNHVAFRYQDGENVLSDVSFTAKQGEITALVGPSGGGKSTAAKLAARFWDIQKGTITMGGVDISRVDPETLLKNYSIVFQDIVLFNDTIMENIRLGRKDASDEEVIAAAKAAQCNDFVMHLPDGYNTVVGENGSTLSGGERQRISIARALLKDSPIVLLDEATASLDVENETSLQTALLLLLKGKTVLIIAHRMRTVMGADKVVVLADGRVAEEGTPKALMNKKGMYYNMVALQQQTSDWTIGNHQ